MFHETNKVLLPLARAMPKLSHPGIKLVKHLPVLLDMDPDERAELRCEIQDIKQTFKIVEGVWIPALRGNMYNKSPIGHEPGKKRDKGAPQTHKHRRPRPSRTKFDVFLKWSTRGDCLRWSSIEDEVDEQDVQETMQEAVQVGL